MGIINKFSSNGTRVVEAGEERRGKARRAAPDPGSVRWNLSGGGGMEGRGWKNEGKEERM